nr:PREDICTED: BTB/POZ domain-containing protein 1-like [Bemisia tabaci]XP_018900606.1 PREDICTED: BTB/POZ domain-containing protein 1-like [Bemisia tabaci]
MSGSINLDPPNCDCSSASIAQVEDAHSDVAHCCLKQRFWWMLHSQTLSDVSFIVGSDSEAKTFHAHKNVLSAGSSVFRSMFSGNWAAESSIRVPDIAPSAFSILLRFIYTDDAPLTVEIASQVLYAAKKYAVFILEMQCSEFLQKNLCPNNAFTILVQAKSLSEKSLAESCLDIIDETAEVAMSCEDFLEIDFPTLCEVLKRDTIKVKETALFDAAVRWATAECSRKGLEVTRENQRSLLEGALSLIRYPLMTQKEFTTSVAESGIINNQDVLDMYYYFSGCSKASFKYNTTPRSSKEPLIASRFESISKDFMMYSRTYQSLRFSFSENVKLLGFGLYTCGRVENFNLLLFLFENSKLIHKEESVQFVTTGHEIHRHYLKTAIPATADVRYCILIRSKVRKSYLL